MWFVEFGLWCMVALIGFMGASIVCFALTGRSLLWRITMARYTNWALEVLKDAIMEGRRSGFKTLDEIAEATVMSTNPNIMPMSMAWEADDLVTFVNYFNLVETPDIHAFVELDNKNEVERVMITGMFDDGSVVELEDGDAEDSPIYGWELMVLEYLVHNKNLHKIKRLVDKAVEKQDRIERGDV